MIKETITANPPTSAKEQSGTYEERNIQQKGNRIIRQMPRLFSNDSSDQQDAATASDSSSNLVLSSLDSFPQLKTVSEHAHYTTIYLLTFRSCRYMTKTRHHRVLINRKGHSEVLWLTGSALLAWPPKRTCVA